MTTWDDAKRKANLAKHGLDLALAESFGWGDALFEEDDSEAYGEQREIATGPIGSILCVYVYTMRGEEDHAISLRKASAREARRYAREIGSTHRR
jgi:uncharacterized DUF497 family protein